MGAVAIDARVKAVAREAKVAAMVAAGVFLLASVCLDAPRVDGQVPPVWLANAFSLAWLVRSRARSWPLLAAAAALGDLAADSLHGQVLPVSIGVALSNAAEELIAAGLLRWRLGPKLDLLQPRHLLEFVLAAGVAAPASGALLSGLAFAAAGQAGYAEGALTWAPSKSLGILILTPCLLTLARAPSLLKEQPLTARGLVALAVLVALSAAIFSQTQVSLLFLIFPALLWVVVELEMLGGVVGVALVGAIAIVATTHGRGPMALIAAGPFVRAIVLQLFLAVAVLKCCALASLLVHRRRLQHSLVAALKDAREHARKVEMAEHVAKVGHWSLDAATREMTWSDEVYRIFGLRPEDGPQFEAAQAMTHPDERERSSALLARALQTGEGWENTVSRVLRPGGQTIYVVGRAVCEKDASGRVTGVFGTLADVTELKQAELALAEREQLMRLMAENANDVIVRVGLDQAITYVSPSVEAMTGYRPDELLGGNWLELIHPQDRVQFQTKVEGVFSSPQAFKPRWMQYRLIRKDGGIVWAEARPKFLFDPSTGAAIGVFDVVRDVTARKRLEVELEAARDEAQAAAAVKSEFLANMSHELRTPITAILGFSRLLEEHAALDETGQRYVSRLLSAGEALLATVNDVLDFSKLEAGQVQIKRRPGSAETVARETVEIFAVHAADKGLTLDFEMGAGAPALLSFDPDRLRQVLLNLVGNAVKFTERGGVRVEGAYDDAAGRLSFKIIDTGPGIDAQGHELLFQRFSQIDGSSTRRHGGTGLGLAICRGLVEAMGGEIGVQSEPGRGSCFSFWIAVEPVDAALLDGGGVPVARLDPGSRVLIADDSASNRSLVRCWLEPLGAEVTEAADGAEAVAAAEAAPFDAILMDIRMPRLDGAEALRRIRAGGGPNQDAPILAFTADVGVEGLRDFLAQGFDGQVGKPLEAGRLIAALAACVNGPEVPGETEMGQRHVG